jgi:hypothetical protein
VTYWILSLKTFRCLFAPPFPRPLPPFPRPDMFDDYCLLVIEALVNSWELVSRLMSEGGMKRGTRRLDMGERRYVHRRLYRYGMYVC